MFLSPAARVTSARFARRNCSTPAMKSPFTTTSPKAIARPSIRARNSSWASPRRRQHPEAVQAAQPEAIVHFAANALVGESMTNPGKYFRNNVCNGLSFARSRSRCRRKEIRLQLDLRHLRPARPRADDRRSPAAADQSVRRIQAHVREDVALVSRAERTGVRRVPILQRRRREPEIRRTSPHRNPSDPECAESSSRPSRASARFTAPIIRLPMALAFAITSTSSTSPRRTSSPSTPGKQGFYNLGNGDGYSVREVIRCARR